jgi:hypothetical protein
MGLNKADIRIIYVAMRIIETGLPYPDEIEEIIDKCKGLLSSNEIMELDEEVDNLFFNSEELKSLAGRILGK